MRVRCSRIYSISAFFAHLRVARGHDNARKAVHAARRSRPRVAAALLVRLHRVGARHASCHHTRSSGTSGEKKVKNALVFIELKSFHLAKEEELVYGRRRVMDGWLGGCVLRSNRCIFQDRAVHTSPERCSRNACTREGESVYVAFGSSHMGHIAVLHRQITRGVLFMCKYVPFKARRRESASKV